MHKTVLATTAMLLGVLVGTPAGAASGAGSDAKKLAQLVVVKSDVPKGWQSQSVASSSDDSEVLAVAACEGRSVGGRVVTARREGRFFTRGDLQLASFAEYLKTTAMAKADFAVVSDPKYPACFDQETRKLAESPSGASSIQSLSVRRITIPKLGQERSAVTIALAALDNGRTQKVTVVQALARRGRAIASITFSRDGAQPFGQKLRDQVVSKLDKRMHKA